MTGTELSRDETRGAPAQVVPRSREKWILAATVIASTMAFADMTIVNVALPVLQRELGMTFSALQWVVESYTLILSTLVLIGGAIGDLYGRRRVFATGIVIFAVASAGCGLSHCNMMLEKCRDLWKCKRPNLAAGASWPFSPPSTT